MDSNWQEMKILAITSIEACCEGHSQEQILIYDSETSNQSKNDYRGPNTIWRNSRAVWQTADV